MENDIMTALYRRCYCAFCRSKRAIYSKRHLSLVDIGLATLATLALMLLIWQDLDPKAFLILALFMGLAEIFIVVRWRLTIVCSHCGFDPVLYKKNPQAAAERVKRFIDRRKEDPASFLTPPPKLPFIVKKKDELAAKPRPGSKLLLKT